MELKIKKLNEKAVIPSYSKLGDAGLDLTAISKETSSIGDVVSYGTGLAIEIPDGFVGLIFPRSSICKKDLSLTNCVGVIDSGYRGEIQFKFRRHARNKMQWDDNLNRIVTMADEYEIGDRIGQLIIIPYPKITIKEVSSLSSSDRNVGGFGSTGK